MVTIGHSAGGQPRRLGCRATALPHGTPGAAPLVAVTGAVAQAGVVELVRAAEEFLGDGGART